MEDPKVKLLRELNQYLEWHPEDTNEFIQACADQLTKFRAKCQVDLNASSRMAIELLLTALSPDANGKSHFDALADRQKIAYLINGMKFHYPKGMESVCDANRVTMDLFIRLVTKEDTLNKDNFWLKHNRHYDWFKMLMDQVSISKYDSQLKTT